MSIEIGSKWIKDGEVVEIKDITETVGRDEVIYYKCKQNKLHVMYDYDFLEQYKPYEEPKQTVVIEKWLCYDNLAESYSICAESNIDGFINYDRDYLSKVKLLDTWEIPL